MKKEEGRDVKTRDSTSKSHMCARSYHPHYTLHTTLSGTHYTPHYSLRTILSHTTFNITTYRGRSEGWSTPILCRAPCLRSWKGRPGRKKEGRRKKQYMKRERMKKEEGRQTKERRMQRVYEKEKGDVTRISTYI